MRPVIGILAEVDDDLYGKVQHAYVHAIEASGGVPVLLPYAEREETIEAFVLLCDGFFFTGGVDIAPERYGEARSPYSDVAQKNRDELEMRVLKKVFKTQKPILGVCRGAQLINIALGGILYQDLPSEFPGDVVHKQAEPKKQAVA